ncbi:MAG: thioredoxin domain-containing protein [Candidatus Electrothrix communis]|nr:MAG: thioredoxin domain-containing protein [Candidatus Electrothrix communis]
MKREHIVIVSAIFLIVVFILGASFYKKQQSEKLGFMAKENTSTFVREHSLTLGSADAKVYLVEFFDPACETCRAFYPFIKKMMAANPGKIKLVMRYAPFHEGADYVVKMLEAARIQGKYWETLEVMYKYQPLWASHHNPQSQLLWRVLPEAGLDLEQLEKDINSPAIDQLIKQDLADAQALNVKKTPGFIVNGKPLQDFGYNQLIELVEAEIKANY